MPACVLSCQPELMLLFSSQTCNRGMTTVWPMQASMPELSDTATSQAVISVTAALEFTHMSQQSAQLDYAQTRERLHT